MISQIPDDQIFITMAHIRSAALCSRGARHWFEKYNLDWNEFLTHGISAERLVATGDTFALRVVEIARKEAHGRR